MIRILNVLLVISIPMLILRKTNLSMSHKTRLGAFLSLSVVMIAVCIIKAPGSIRPGHKSVDLQWELYWLHMEGCLAILMGSLSTVRNVFNRGRRLDPANEFVSAGTKEVISDNVSSPARSSASDVVKFRDDTKREPE